MGKKSEREPGDAMFVNFSTVGIVSFSFLLSFSKRLITEIGVNSVPCHVTEDVNKDDNKS